MTNIPRSARQFVQQWAELNRIQVRANGQVKGVDVKTAFATLALDYAELCNIEDRRLKEAHHAAGHKGAPPKCFRISQEMLEHAWTEYPEKVRRVERERLVGTVLPFNGETDLVYQWLTAMCGEVSETDVAIMSHFLWQVKRRALELPVVYHVCPIFFGKQGSGKTTAIGKLLQPIEELSTHFSPDEATDPRSKAAFENNLICFFDEMANMARVEMEELKKLITADSLTYRPLYTNSSVTIAQNCSFIGGSNKSMAEIVYDPTGLRRFYEFTCKDKADFDKINSIDYMALWHSIDPSLERGYTEHLQERIAAHQNSRKTQDEVQQFINENAITGGETVPMLAVDLYSAYIAWRAVAGYAVKPALPINIFGMKLSTYKVPKTTSRVDGTTKSAYRINKHSLVFNKRIPTMQAVK